VLRGKFIVTSAHIRILERFQVNYPILHLKLLEKQEQVNPKNSRWKEIRVETSELEMNRTIQQSMKQKVGFLKRTTNFNQINQKKKGEDPY
jgi:predicted SprT family Zn-dependent metalloprotease